MLLEYDRWRLDLNHTALVSHDRNPTYDLVARETVSNLYASRLLNPRQPTDFD